MPADGIGFGQAAADMDEERQFRRVVAVMEGSDRGDARLSGFAEACTLLDDWYFASPKDRIDVLTVRQVGLAINGDSVILSADAAHALADVAQEILVETAEGPGSRAISDMVRSLRTTAHAVTRSASSTVASSPSEGLTMRSGAAATSHGTSLRDKLHRRGAKPHRRMSDLARYMLTHYDELHALITVDRYGWADIAGVLADEGLTDGSGRPVTADVAKLAWSHLVRRSQSDFAEREGAPACAGDAGLCDRGCAVSDSPAATLADFDASTDLAGALASLQTLRSGPLRLLRAAYWATGDRASALAVHEAIEYVSSALRPLQRCRDN